MANVLMYIDENFFPELTDTIREKTGRTEKMKTAALLTAAQEELRNAEISLQEKTAIPSADSQTIEPDADYDGLAKVTIEGDENLVAENIAEGVSIFGVVGTHAGGGSGGSGESDVLKYVTFMSEDGTTELYKMPVITGDDCKDPVTTGKITAPTKISTEQYAYTYSGWSSTSGGSADTTILENIASDKTVYASFASSLVQYTVTFYDGDTVVATKQVGYGLSSDYAYMKEGYTFDGWVPEPVNVTDNMSCYAQFTPIVVHEWTSVSTAPYKAGYSKLVSYDGKLWLIGGGPADTYDEASYVYTWDGSTWTQMPSLPVKMRNHFGAIVYNNELHVMGGVTVYDGVANSNHHYKWNGSSWVLVSTLPVHVYYPTVQVIDNELHLLASIAGSEDTEIYYKWNGNEWTCVYSENCIDSERHRFVLYNDEIHSLGSSNNSKQHYMWDGANWTELSDMPVNGSRYSYVCILENMLHLFYYTNHYTWDGTEWTAIDTALPSRIGCVAVHDGRIYSLGGDYLSETRTLYSW